MFTIPQNLFNTPIIKKKPVQSFGANKTLSLVRICRINVILLIGSGSLILKFWEFSELFSYVFYLKNDKGFIVVVHVILT